MTAKDDFTAFDAAFEALTDNKPFPWQRKLYARLLAGEIPDSCDIPTGLGKTAVIPIWLIALANAPAKVARRLVYIVNRRTVVDQATAMVERIRQRLTDPDHDDWRKHEEALRSLNEKLMGLAATDGPPLAVSTLRGQFADNAEWRADPARPAVVVGTIDMIGSRLLFSGYRCGFKSRPLHAGFLGQDSLVVHDEAHLELPFQTLLESIENEQRRGRFPDFLPMRVMALSATSRGGANGTSEEEPKAKPLGLTDADRKNPVVKKRIHAKKGVRL
ncbi:MAG: type I-U CRISPR-associated helicase/endonuclease Cas3, partial [Pirellulaceae bacterium]|nr:type I-U CRISPR-associated helicase/endonuclease Cas3 [Pirellulaceae bacterium]